MCIQRFPAGSLYSSLSPLPPPQVMFYFLNVSQDRQSFRQSRKYDTFCCCFSFSSMTSFIPHYDMSTIEEDHYLLFQRYNKKSVSKNSVKVFGFLIKQMVFSFFLVSMYFFDVLLLLLLKMKILIDVWSFEFKMREKLSGCKCPLNLIWQVLFFFCFLCPTFFITFYELLFFFLRVLTRLFL